MIHEEYIRFKSPGHLSVQVSDIIKSDRAKWTGITLELTLDRVLVKKKYALILLHSVFNTYHYAKKYTCA